MRYCIVNGPQSPRPGDSEIVVDQPLTLVDNRLINQPQDFWIENGHWTLRVDAQSVGRPVETSKVGPWEIYFYPMEEE